MTSASEAWWVREGGASFVAERLLRGAAPGLYRVILRARGRDLPSLDDDGSEMLAPDVESKVRADYCREVHGAHAPFAPDSGAVLEIGPGSSVGACALFARAGREAWAVDRFAWDFGEEQRALHAELGTTDSIPERAIGPAEAMPFPDGRFSFVYSHACLEHVLEPDRVAREIARVLTPDGTTSHQVDAGDHRHRDRPLDYLTVPAWAWSLMSRGRRDYQNRWRAVQYERAFAAVFEEVEIRVGIRATAEQLGDRRRFARPYRSMAPEELDPIGFLVVARRPR